MTVRRITCIVCPVGCEIEVAMDDGQVVRVEGNACARGYDYAKVECTSPQRVLTTIISVKGGSLSVTSVKTTKPIPKKLLMIVRDEISQVVLEAPVARGQVVKANVLGTGADVVVTRTVDVKRTT